MNWEGSVFDKENQTITGCLALVGAMVCTLAALALAAFVLVTFARGLGCS